MEKLNNSKSKGQNIQANGGAPTGVATEQVKPQSIRPYATSFGIGIEPDSGKLMLAEQAALFHSYLAMDFIMEDLQDFTEENGDLKDISMAIAIMRTKLRKHPDVDAKDYRDLCKVLRSFEVLCTQIYNNWLPNLQDIYQEDVA